MYIIINVVMQYAISEEKLGRFTYLIRWQKKKIWMDYNNGNFE